MHTRMDGRMDGIQCNVCIYVCIYVCTYRRAKEDDEKNWTERCGKLTCTNEMQRGEDNVFLHS